MPPPSLCVTPKKTRIKRGRLFNTPTGFSPRQKQRVSDQKQGRWTKQEKDFISTFVASSKDHVDWKLCSSELREKIGSNRTAKACHSTYSRQNILFSGEDDLTVGPLQNVELADVGVQTDISIGPRDVFAFGSMRESSISDTGDGAEGTASTSASPASLRTLLLGQTHRTAVPDQFPSPCVSFTPLPKGKVFQKRTSSMAVSSPLREHSYSRKASPTKRRPKKPSKNVPRIKNQISGSILMSPQPKPEHISLWAAIRLKVIVQTRDARAIAKCVLGMPALKARLMDLLFDDVGDRPEMMRHRTQGYVSALMPKDYAALQSLDFGDIVAEMKDKFPEVLHLLSCLMLPKEKRRSIEAITHMVPRMAFIYGCIMQARNQELSLVQRTVAACLAENICDQKVYDRLNKLGVCTSYTRSLVVFNQIGTHFMDRLNKAAAEGRDIRFIGDNLNFMVRVGQETMSHHKHMVHMFASAALVSDHHLLNNSEAPEIPLEELTVDDITLSKTEYAAIRNDCIKLVADVAAKYLPQLSFVTNCMPTSPPRPNGEGHTSKTEVIPLPVLPYNEQFYQDDVKILDYYENIVKKIGENVAGWDEGRQVHIGGDQLTRERFVGAMRLRLGNYNPRDRFAHLGPVTFEFFHLGMNYLEKMVYDSLWNKTGMIEIGTLRGEKERIIRDSVDPCVAKAYEADREYFHSFVNAYIVEALQDHFGMHARNDMPSKNAPPAVLTQEERIEWVNATLGEFVDKYVFPSWNDHQTDELVCEDVNQQQQYVVVNLANGRQLHILLPKTKEEVFRQRQPDKVKDYGHYVLEAGLTFRYFLSLIKTADRDRLLPLFKVMMMQLKARNPKAKYPLELLHLLIQQYSLLPLNKACQVFSACFVNNKGKYDTHVPADLQMEWLVKESKAHIKHMFSNKTQDNIEGRSASLPGIHAIGANFDQAAGTILRAKKHNKKDSAADELRIMDDLRRIRPFEHHEGRSYTSFQDIPKSQVEKFDGYYFRAWFDQHKNGFEA